VNSTVIQPSIEKATDPTFRAGVLQYVSESSKNANEWGKAQLGVDVGTVVGTVATNVATTGKGAFDSLTGGSGSYRRAGYAPPGQQHYNEFGEDDGSALYADGGDDAFFHDFTPTMAQSSASPSIVGGKVASSSIPSTVTASQPTKPKTDDWNDDQWKDF
jgi:ADP-ribosylation factor GTPase-activating protein 1